MKIVGHRGCMVHAPENTMAAFARAWAEEADGIELDVHLSRDGEVVVHHDHDLRRTAGRDVAVADLTIAELRTQDVGSWKGTMWRGQHPPTLSEVVRQAPRDRLIFVEIKCGPVILPVLIEKRKQGLLQADRFWFVGFDMAVMAAVKNALPDFKVLLNLEAEQYENVPGAAAYWLERVAHNGLDGVGAGLSNPDWMTLRWWKERGLSLFAWVVRDADTARGLREIGVDAAAADCPAELRAWLKEAGTWPP